MASTMGPSNSDEPPRVQRSFTLPTKLAEGGSRRTSDRLPGNEHAIEVLFTHPTGRIVAFSPTLSDLLKSTRPVSAGGKIPNDEVVGVLPWASHYEKTMASGAIRVYRVPGSVAFLNSGKILHAILPKSQCWCVDNETKFVLRIRGNNYYRIELPNTCEEDRRAADELKTTFAEVLQYEMTACPFKRGFFVELPEKNDVPKKPWTPKHRPITSPTSLPMSSGDEGSVSHSDQESSSNSAVGDEERSNIIRTKTFVAGSTDSPRDDSIRHATPEPVVHRIEPLISAFEEMKTFTTPAKHTPSCSRPSSASSRADGQTTGADVHTNLAAPLTSRVSTESLEITRPKVVQNSEVPLPGQRTSTNSGFDIASDPFYSKDTDDSTTSSRPSQETTQDFHKNNGHDSGFNTTTGVSASGLDMQHRSFTSPPILDSYLSSLPQANQPEVTQIAEDLAPRLDDSESDLNALADSENPSTPTTSSYSSPPPPSSNESGIAIARRRGHQSTLSTVTIKANPTSPSLTMTESLSPDNSSFKSINPDNADVESPEITIDTDVFTSPESTPPASPRRVLRHQLSMHRSRSPMPPSATLYDPREITQGHDITSVLLQRTASILVTPPAFLVALMLKIARRISNGVTRGTAPVSANSGRRILIPGAWESDDEGISDDESEDDYGISLR